LSFTESVRARRKLEDKPDPKEIEAEVVHFCVRELRS
jgi:hypothetical protein